MQQAACRRHVKTSAADSKLNLLSPAVLLHHTTFDSHNLNRQTDVRGNKNSDNTTQTTRVTKTQGTRTKMFFQRKCSGRVLVLVRTQLLIAHGACQTKVAAVVVVLLVMGVASSQ